MRKTATKIAAQTTANPGLAASKPNRSTKPRAPVAKSKRGRKTTQPAIAPHSIAPDNALVVVTGAAGAADLATATIVAEPTETSAKPARATKRDLIVALLGRAEGASIAELMAATGWLPHTTRAALSGLRKRGLLLERSSADGTSRYRIAA